MRSTKPLLKHNPSQPEEAIDIRDLLKLLLRHKLLLCIALIIAICVGVVICKTRTPIYESDVLLNINSNNNSNIMSSLMGSMNSPFSALGDNNALLATEQQIITSRSVVEPTVKILHLNISVTPHYFPLLGHRMALNYNLTNFTNMVAPPKFGLSQYDWGGASIAIRSFIVGPALEGQAFLLKNLGNNQFELLSNGTLISKGTVGQAININPGQYNQLSLLIDNIHANPGTEFTLNSIDIASATDRLTQKIQATPTAQMSNLIKVTLTGESPQKTAETLETIANQVVQSSAEQTALQATQTLTFLHNLLPETERQLNEAETKLNQYRAKTGNVDLKAQTKIILDALNQVETQLIQAQLEKVQLSYQYTPNSLPMQQANAMITQYQQQVDALNQQLRSTPEADQALLTLTRDATIQNTIYTNLLKSQQKYELIKASTIGNVNIIDHANIPYAPINLPGAMIILVCIFLALFITMLYIFIRHYFTQGLTDPDILENMLDLPVLTTIHENPDQINQAQKFKRKIISQLKLVSELDEQSIASESFRSLRTNIIFKLKQSTKNIITISGPSPEIGKSFVSANLAAALAELGQRVLLLDADVRRGDLYRYFMGPYKPGFTDLLEEKVTLEECIQHTRLPNLDFLPTGSYTNSHTKLLNNPICQDVLEKLSRQYDIVLIDTAPILALTDALTLGQYAALRLLVLRHGKHSQKEIELCLNQFRKVNLPVDGAILNRAPLKTGALDYYGYNYRYSYRSKKNENSQ